MNRPTRHSAGTTTISLREAAAYRFAAGSLIIAAGLVHTIGRLLGA